MEMTVRRANAMINGTELVINGGINCLGVAQGRFVTEKLPGGNYRITKLPDVLDRATANALVRLNRHGSLLLAGDIVLTWEGRERVTGVSRATFLAADHVIIDPLTGRVDMTNRGRGFFRPQERLVLSVPADMTGVVLEAVDHALNRHHE